MYNKKTLLSLYNQISDEKTNQEEIEPILPKLYLIINKVKMDEVEIIRTMDTLREINKLGQLDKITSEVIDLIIRITKRDNIDLEGALYFSVLLKHVIVPYNLNVCDKDYNLLVFLSEFEIFIELINKMLNKKDLLLLDKYNHELKEIIMRYKATMYIYRKYVTNDIILDTMISHFATMLYFNLDNYDKDYNLLIEIVVNIINNYQEFADYCYSHDVFKNFIDLSDDLSGIEKEYIVSNDMLKYLFNNREKGKIKRK